MHIEGLFESDAPPPLWNIMLGKSSNNSLFTSADVTDMNRPLMLILKASCDSNFMLLSKHQSWCVLLCTWWQTAIVFADLHKSQPIEGLNLAKTRNSTSPRSTTTQAQASKKCLTVTTNMMITITTMAMNTITQTT